MPYPRGRARERLDSGGLEWIPEPSCGRIEALMTVPPDMSGLGRAEIIVPRITDRIRIVHPDRLVPVRSVYAPFH